ncbi:MAG: 3-hydroxyacyl-ACP dehydratase FabZ [Rickettsiales bacterium]|nr:3-hydroxyacyl-ACP dehydratase FabZ [Rickettsiales bacterium]
MTDEKPTKIEIGIEQIIKDLPHRYPFLLIDKVTILDPFKQAIGFKNVTFNEPHFTGHFPDRPIMPGVLIVEAMAQSAAIMIMNSATEKSNEDKLVYFMGIDKVKFRKPVIPGDVLELHITTIQGRSSVWKMSGVAMVAGQKVAEAEFSAMFVDKNKAQK